MSAAAQLAPQMVVTLQKVKHSPSLSEETNAFTADVCFDGVKVAVRRAVDHFTVAVET